MSKRKKNNGKSGSQISDYPEISNVVSFSEATGLYPAVPASDGESSEALASEALAQLFSNELPGRKK